MQAVINYYCPAQGNHILQFRRHTQKQSLHPDLARARGGGAGEDTLNPSN